MKQTAETKGPEVYRGYRIDLERFHNRTPEMTDEEVVAAIKRDIDASLALYDTPRLSEHPHAVAIAKHRAAERQARRSRL